MLNPVLIHSLARPQLKKLCLPCAALSCSTAINFQLHRTAEQPPNHSSLCTCTYTCCQNWQMEESDGSRCDFLREFFSPDRKDKKQTNSEQRRGKEDRKKRARQGTNQIEQDNPPLEPSDALSSPPSSSLSSLRFLLMPFPPSAHRQINTVRFVSYKVSEPGQMSGSSSERSRASECASLCVRACVRQFESSLRLLRSLRIAAAAAAVDICHQADSAADIRQHPTHTQRVRVFLA